MEYVVDMQGFKQPGNDFVLKELAILCLSDNSEPLVRLFKEPFPWKRLTDMYWEENLWLERHYHGIPWSSGDFDYTLIGTIIRETLKDATRIIVRNQIIQQWMRKRWSYQQIINLEEWGYPAKDLPRQVTVCTNHNGEYKATCALHNVKLMKTFYFDDIFMEWEEISETVSFQ